MKRKEETEGKEKKYMQEGNQEHKKARRDDQAMNKKKKNAIQQQQKKTEAVRTNTKPWTQAKQNNKNKRENDLKPEN